MKTLGCFFLIMFLVVPGVAQSVTREIQEEDYSELTPPELEKWIDSLYLKGEYNKAIEFTLYLTQTAREDTNINLEIKSYNYLGDLARAMGDYTSSLLYLQKALTFNQVPDTLLLASTYNLLAATYFEMLLSSHNDSARIFAEKALRLARIVGDDALIYSSLNIIGSIKLINKENEAALKDFREALPLAQKIRPIDLSLLEIHIAQAYLQMGQDTKAISLAEKAFERAKKDDVKVYIRLISDFLREYYYKIGNKAKAYYYLEELTQSVQSIFQEKTQKRIGELEASIKMANAERENVRLRLEEDLHQRRMDLVIVLLGFIGGVAILALIFLFVLRRQRNRLRDSNSRMSAINKQLIRQKEETEIMARELDNTNATLKKFISIMAHDLKNPFNTIIGFSDLLLTEYDDLTEEERKKAIENTHHASVNAFNLLEHLLEWVRMQLGFAQFKQETCDVKTLMDEVIALLKPSFEIKKQTIDASFEGKLVIQGDCLMLLTVFRNLLSNANKFSHLEGTITIRGFQREHQVYISVSDKGIGIPSNQLSKLFNIQDQFKRLGTNKEKGTGLGLLLCKEYVEKNEGSISVESTEGKGTTFTLIFPAA